MTAIITSNFYNHYSANFSLLNNFISKIKPNKVITNNEGINLLRNRTKTAVAPKPKNKLGERVQNLFKKKEKVVNQPYSLRSKLLDDPNQRKIISSVNRELKQTPLVSSFTPSLSMSKNYTPNAKTFSNLKQARKNASSKRKQEVYKTRQEIQQKKLKNSISDNNTQLRNAITRNEQLKNQNKITPPKREVIPTQLLPRKRKTTTQRKISQPQWNFLTEPTVTQYPFLTERYRRA